MKNKENKTARDLKTSETELGQIYPVIKDQFGNILDGVHRKEVNPNWKETTVQVADRLHALKIRLHANVIRREVGWDEKHGWVMEARQLLNPNDPMSVSQEEVGKALGMSQPWVSKYDTLLQRDNVELRPLLFNVWNFSALDKRFGTYGYPGQIPGQIVWNLLYYYTNEGDLVVDPMAGGGTTIDVCNYINRKCLAYDLHPSRSDIKQNDIRNGYPEETKDCDLIFLDPPYYNAVHRDKPFFKDLNDFYDFITKLAQNSLETIKKSRYVALLMLSKDNKAEEVLSLNCGKIFLETGFKTVESISCPLTTDSADPREVEWAKKNHRMLGRNRDLHVFKRT